MRVVAKLVSPYPRIPVSPYPFIPIRDPRIPIPDSVFVVRETGFSVSWFGSALLSRKVQGLIHPFPDWGIRLRGIGGSKI